jgi:hypothetical protein
MPDQYTGPDSLYEYLTGAGSDGGAQTDPAASLGNYRSSTEAASLGIQIANALAGVSILFAGGGNPLGDGVLVAPDSTHLTWKPFGAGSAGSPVAFSGTQIKAIPGPANAGQYLRVQATTPLTPGSSTITLSPLYNKFFGFDNVAVADAAAGLVNYRGSIIRNESAVSVTSIKRWIGELATSAITATGGGLGASGAGTITTSGTFADWPDTGWCHVFASGGTDKEIVYYTSRTDTVLTVPAAGRAQLGSTATAGTTGDTLHSVPGIAIAVEPGGAQAFGSSIQTIANQTTAPAGVTWNTGILSSTGLNIGTLATNQQIGFWLKRAIPAGCKASPREDVLLNESFNAA